LRSQHDKDEQIEKILRYRLSNVKHITLKMMSLLGQ
jgi:hypothetical protein